ncbi:MAG: alanine racemase [Candidatus Omnitrophica bacterium]|nr:alanine racemase [Candidatus Omnitrophota bacterium]
MISQNGAVRRVWTEIDLKAIRRNLSTIRSLVGPEAALLIVVKSDAYGHGMVEVSRTLVRGPGPAPAASLQSGPGEMLFGIGRPEEAARLREAGIANDLILLAPFLRNEVPDIFEHNITPSVGDAAGAELLNRAAMARGKKLAVHLKVDTGMGRSGVWHEEALDFALEFPNNFPHLHMEGVLTHFSEADSPDGDFTEAQVRSFNALTAGLAAHAIKPRFIHAANSAALLKHRATYFNMVRPGLCVYGVFPGIWRPPDLNLAPVLSWKARVTLVRDVPEGRFISYRRSFQTRGRARIATVSAGYADGYPVALSNCGRVLVRGKSAPVVGQVTMDQLLVDVTAIPDVFPEDEVVLIGKQGKEQILVEELAQRARTIPYELLCGISKHIPRFYNEL